jgi:hypothetical protein
MAMTKKVLIRSILSAALALGAVGGASAEVVCYPSGCVNVPVCRNVWVQTGPFVGQGYWTTVCN